VRCCSILLINSSLKVSPHFQRVTVPCYEIFDSHWRMACFPVPPCSYINALLHPIERTAVLRQILCQYAADGGVDGLDGNELKRDVFKCH